MLSVSLDCVVFLLCFSQRNWQHRVHKTERNKAKTQHHPEKLAIQGRKDGEKQSKNTTQSRETGNIG
jgi:hypothetical protein